MSGVFHPRKAWQQSTTNGRTDCEATDARALSIVQSSRLVRAADRMLSTVIVAWRGSVVGTAFATARRSGQRANRGCARAPCRRRDCRRLRDRADRPAARASSGGVDLDGAGVVADRQPVFDRGGAHEAVALTSPKPSQPVRRMLALSPIPEEGAGCRFRIAQFIPYLESDGYRGDPQLVLHAGVLPRRLPAGAISPEGGGVRRAGAQAAAIRCEGWEPTIWCSCIARCFRSGRPSIERLLAGPRHAADRLRLRRCDFSAERERRQPFHRGAEAAAEGARRSSGAAIT